MTTPPVIAAIVPCFNEEVAVGKVCADLMTAIPGVTVYVYDNNSSDNTSAVAAAAGAVVRTEPRKGKGNVIRRALADIDADIYLMIDGDDTYDAAAAPNLIQALQDGPYDHVLGVRKDVSESSSSYRPGHEQGNRLFNRLVGSLFGEPVSDMLSGYRVFSRRFVKSFPSLSRGFEIETELTVHAMNLRVPQIEVPVGFRDRPVGSESKLRTYHDGMRILSLIVRLLQYERPLAFYGIAAAVLTVAGLALGLPVVFDFFQTGMVPRLPTAVLSSSLILVAVLALVVGILLNGILRMRQEASRLAYLRWPAPACASLHDHRS